VTAGHDDHNRNPGSKTAAATNQTSERLCLSIPEVAVQLGISRSNCYELCRAGDIPTIRLGLKRLVVPRAALEKWLEAQTKGGMNCHD